MSKSSVFDLGVKAEQLYFNIFDITTSRDHYPVRHRRLADKLQEYALEIHSNIIDANSLKNDNPQRFVLQTSVISTCDKLLSLTKYSVYAKLISFATSEKWTGLIHDIKYMTLAWRKT